MWLLAPEEIARELNVSRPTVDRWRSGETAPSAIMTPFIINGIAKAQAKKIVEKIKEDAEFGDNLTQYTEDGEIREVVFTYDTWQSLIEEIGE